MTGVPASREKLYLVDVSTYLFRAFHSIPTSIVLPGGRGPANALYGLLQTLAKLVREREVRRVACVLDDVAADAERDRIDPAYKAARRDWPPLLAPQAMMSGAALQAAGFPVAFAPGAEADDVLATLAARAHAARESVVVVGVDKDLLQVLAPGDALFDLARDRFVPYEEASSVLGVPPEKTADFLALAGDPVDAIGGVPGIGKKTAALLVNELGGVAEIYAALDRVLEVPGLRGARSIRDKLAAHEADARRAFALATLKTNVPVALGLEQCAYRGTVEAGRRALKELFGFEKLPERFPRAD
jgi:DNA polymerase-1